MTDSDKPESTKTYTPVLPFDRTLHEDFSMYDKLTYTRDLSLFDCNEVMMNRGNVIHFYECKNVEPRKVGGDVIDVEPSSEEDIPQEEAVSDEADEIPDGTADKDIM